VQRWVCACGIFVCGGWIHVIFLFLISFFFFSCDDLGDGFFSFLFLLFLFFFLSLMYIYTYFLFSFFLLFPNKVEWRKIVDTKDLIPSLYISTSLPCTHTHIYIYIKTATSLVKSNCIETLIHHRTQ
jgi:hypothetical protein